MEISGMTAGEKPLVVAVVVNWNGRRETLRCLRSLRASRPSCPRIIVVDNGSNDDSVRAIHAFDPRVTVMSLPLNRHFAAAANQGLRAARKAGADFVWLLNNDVMVAPDALAAKMRLVQKDGTIGIVGARLVHPVDPPGIIVGANCDFRSGAIIEPKLAAGDARDRLTVDYVWGCAMLIRGSVIDEIGLLAEEWVAYFEDADYCLRARKAKWQTVTALQALVFHEGSKSANRRFLQQMWLRGRNWWRCYWRHADPAERPWLALSMAGYRLPQLAWSTLVTILARKLRPRGREIQLWQRRRKDR